MMNIERIIRVTSCYLFLTGYQIRWYDRKTLHYRLPIFGVLYFLILLILYLICFCHHFESSSVLKVLLDISPFLKHLVRFHVLLGLKVYVFCMIEYKNLAKIFNGLIRIFTETIQCRKSFDPKETVVYLLFFFTLMVALSFGLYIAIEMKFEIPPLDHIMIGVALLMPHLTLAGCLRLYTLGLWLIKREIATILTILKAQEEENDLSTTECITIVEIVNPVFNNNSSVATLYGFYEKIVKRVEVVTDYLKIFDKILQRQLSILVGMNFNCMLAGVYSHVYFKNTWNVLFTDRNRRIFYAANSAIFVCILVDYGVLLITLWSFNGAVSEKKKLFQIHVHF